MLSVVVNESNGCDDSSCRRGKDGSSEGVSVSIACLLLAQLLAQ